MKKTLTVNLGGSVYHIDEDAYLLLDKYLSNLRVHFQKEEGAEEILHDFEMRIGELFTERIRLGYEVITIAETEAVIKRMGNPEEFFGEDADMDEPQSEPIAPETQKTSRKRLYRDPDNRILGGVAGGLSAYMGWDATAIRLAMLLLLFLYGITIPFYLVLWLIVPKARTATEKLEMRGESVTIESIGKTVTDGHERFSNDLGNAYKDDNGRTLGKRFADGMVSVIGVVLKILLIIFAICIFPPLLLMFFVLVVVLIALFGGLLGGGLGAFGGLGMLDPFAGFQGLESLAHLPMGMTIVASIGMLIVISIPIIALASFVATRFFNFKPMPMVARYVLIALFLFAIASMFIAFYVLPFSNADAIFLQQGYSPVFYGI